nr:hypothetical protein Iba_chr11cCG4850 [Ipomoea batatas]
MWEPCSPEIVSQKLPCLVQICSPKELLPQPSSPREGADRRRAVATAARRQGSKKTRQQLLPAVKQQSPLGLEPPSLSSTSSDATPETQLLE